MKAGKKSFIFLDIERFYLTRERVNIEDGPEEKKKQRWVEVSQLFLSETVGHLVTGSVFQFAVTLERPGPYILQTE